MKTSLVHRCRTLPDRLRNRHGILLAIIFVLCLGVMLVAAGTIKVVNSDTTLNERNLLKLQADNAAEAVSEWALGQMKLRWDSQSQTSVTPKAFITNPITFPADKAGWLFNGTIVDPNSISIKVGLVPTSPQLLYIDPNDPNNTFDPQRGKFVSAVNVNIYTSAKAASRVGAYTSYAVQALQIRNASLFSHAIFYNMDLEFHPGPAMSITGPVHANGNIWAVCQTALTFSGPVTTAGNFNVGLVPWPTDWTSSGQGNETGALVYIPNATGNLKSPYKGNSTNQFLASSYWDDRTSNFTNAPGNFTNWRELSSNLWGGNLQTKDHGVPTQNVVGYQNYIPDAYGNGTNTDLNYAYAIIEPNQFNPTTNNYHKGTGENDKFARKAGLTISILNSGIVNITVNSTIPINLTSGQSATNATLNTSAINTTVNSWINNQGNLTGAIGTNMTVSYATASNATTSTSGNSTTTDSRPAGHPNAFLLVTQMAQNATVGGNDTVLMEPAAANIHVGSGGNATTSIKTQRTVGYAWVELYTMNTTVDATGLRTPNYNGTTQMTDAQGNVIYAGDVQPVNITVNASWLTSNTSSPIYGLLKFRPVVGNVTMNTTTGNVASNMTTMWNGMYDGRRTENIQTIDLDMGKLRNLLDDHVAAQGNTSGNFFWNGTSNTTTYVPRDMYNGVIYVQFPQLAGNAARLSNITNTVTNITNPGDKVTVSQEGWGLVITNGTSTPASNITGVPDPLYNNPDVTANATGRTRGFTLATNNALYVLGNFNADGNMSTPAADTTANLLINSTMPDGNTTNPDTADPACALVSDSFTALSGSFNRTSTAVNPTATATEVNAAVIAGIVPSKKTSSTQLSGGSHNFPRFLENWGSVDFRYRGSMVCLFEAEIANEPFGSGYYSPPTREWGFYNQFAQGNYPPGVPGVRSYYRVGYRQMQPKEYNTAVAAIPTS